MTTSSVLQAVSAATARLAAVGVDSPRHDAEELAAHLLGVRRGSLGTAGQLDDDAYDRLVRRREGREPLQHITGMAGFRYLDLLVGPGALVPRPETELVAGAAIAGARAVVGRAPVVVDLGTGTGAIALAVAAEVPGAVVHGVDSSPEALRWAQRNVEDLALPVSLHEMSAASALPELDGSVDVVVSNPPYLLEGTQISAEVGYDPALALWGGEDGLTVIREVVAAAARLLRPGGVFVMEHDDRHAAEVLALLTADATCAWTGQATHQDLTGRDRYVTATLLEPDRSPS